MGIIKKYHDKKWTLQFLDALYNSIDIEDIDVCYCLVCALVNVRLFIVFVFSSHIL
jgi:hypothetical protein